MAAAAPGRVVPAGPGLDRTLSNDRSDEGEAIVRVLGVDPGLTRCGVGVVDGAPGRALTLVHVEVIRTAANAELGLRLVELADAFADAITRFAPDVVAVERVFSQHNVRTVMGTAQVAGLAILEATRAGLPVVLHTPSEVKAAVTGSGNAGKAQVGAMVTRLLKLTDTPRPADAADALALAICHVWRGAAQTRLAAAVAGQRR
jgi:crossover junction endodeoxyribonuclease RuvC